MRRMMLPGAALAAAALLFGVEQARAEDPFAAGADALAVKEADGSSSLRAKKKLKKMEDDMVMVEVAAIDDAAFPACTFTAKVIKEAKAKDKHFKLLGANKVYRFAPVLKMKGAGVDLADKMTQNNLGACYYPPRTKLVVKVGGVDMKIKAFSAAELYVK